jgi:hypothetical protein
MGTLQTELARNRLDLMAGVLVRLFPPKVFLTYEFQRRVFP